MIKEKISNLIFKKNEGVALYFALLILSSIMVITASVASMMIGQFNISGDIRKSMKAVYAADSGLEKALFEVRKNGRGDAPALDCLAFGLVLPAGAVCTLDISGTAILGGDVILVSKGKFSGFFRQIQAVYKNE
jgi:Tfp pilus assembly protein PilX